MAHEKNSSMSGEYFIFHALQQGILLPVPCKWDEIFLSEVCHGKDTF
jgi:hypothetical protein